MSFQNIVQRDDYTTKPLLELFTEGQS